MHDVKNYWDRCYESGKDFRVLTHQSITRFLDYVPQGRDKTCLDIGCGTGQLTRELVHRGYECLGIDASPKAVATAKLLTVLPQARYLCIDIEQESVPQLQRYALITCKYVYAFIADKPAFLQKVTELLNDEGIFVVITPLIDDVPAEKRSIAVDLEQTMAELHDVFATVETFAEQGATCFVCKRRTADMTTLIGPTAVAQPDASVLQGLPRGRGIAVI